MGQAIWEVLTGYEGRWVAVAGHGEVVAHAASLPEVMSLVATQQRRVTFLYAAAAAAKER